MLGAGRYDTRMAFQRRATVDDGYGNVQGAWQDYWVCWGVYDRKFGRERLAAGQLEATSKGTIVVRRCARAMMVNEGDRITFRNGPNKGRSVQIRSRIMSADNSEIEFMIEDGVAT